MKYHEIKQFARELRNNPTPEEQKLWQFLRKRQICGYKFLRQHPIIYESRKGDYYFYIPDFYCASKRLIIELDGKIHNYQKNHDRHREEVLEGQMLNVLRIRNEELKNMESVIQKIKDMLDVLH
jgi:very-short-patch-repair endonuclease